MKRALAFFSIFTLTLLLFISCGHSHSFSSEWEYDEENHWHEANCEHTEEKSNFGAHADSDDDGVCDECDATMHEHTFTNAWISDATKHWRESTCIHEGLRFGEAEHVDVDENGECDVCTMGMHKHTFNTAVWNFDETGHWHPAICEGHEDRRGNFTPHATADNDGVCDTCGFDEMHVHTFNTEAWSFDETGHWHPATCEGHEDIRGSFAPHTTADNDGICDDCGFDDMHIHTMSDSEYLSNTEGHWFKANCGHDDYVDELLPHVDALDDGVCDDCGRRLKYTVTAVVTQTEKLSIIGDSVALVAIGGDATFTVRVDSKYALYVTTGGGEIVGTPTTDGGFTTYTVVVSDVANDVTLTLVAKVENAYDYSTLPGVPDVTESTKTVYYKDGVYSVNFDAEATAYVITYQNAAINRYDPETETYNIDKVARIKSIKQGGEETTITWEGVTYGASGEGVTTTIPTRNWLGITRGFAMSYAEARFESTTVLAVDPTALYVFETDVLVERTGEGYAFEICLPDDNGNYAANTAMFQVAGGNNLQAAAMKAGSAGGALSDTGAVVGEVFNLRIVVTENADNAAKMDFTLYINGNPVSSVTVNKIANVRVRFFPREDGPVRNSVITLMNTSFVKYEAHTHTFDESAWLSDGNGHWHAPTCGHDVKGNYAEHDSAENNGVCDVCGKTDIHVHTASDSEYLHDVTGHWFAPTCGHAHYKTGFAAHTDEDGDDSCDVCSRQMLCTVSVDMKTTYAIVVGDGAIKGAPGSDVTFTVTCPVTHALIVNGAEIVGTPTEISGINTYTVKVAAIADDTTVTLSTKRVAVGHGTLWGSDPLNKIVTVWDNNGTFAKEDNGGTKYVITYAGSAVKVYDEVLDTITFTKVARIVSIKNAANEDSVITWQGVTYGASGEGVVTVIPSRNWLGITRGFSVDVGKADITPILNSSSEVLYHFEADVTVDRELTAPGDTNPIFTISLPQAETGNAQASMAIYFDPAYGGRLTLYQFGKGSNIGAGQLVNAYVGEVFNLALDIVENTEVAGSRDLIVYVNGEAVATSTISSVDCDGRIRIEPRDDGSDRNYVVTFSNIYATKKS